MYTYHCSTSIYYSIPSQPPAPFVVAIVDIVCTLTGHRDLLQDMKLFCDKLINMIIIVSVIKLIIIGIVIVIVIIMIIQLIIIIIH